MNNKRIKSYCYINLVVMALCLAFGFSTSAQTSKVDTNHAVVQKSISKDSLKSSYKIIPRVATLRSAMVPGWGQIYNRQKWKLPFIAAAFGVNIYFIAYNDIRYHYYENLYGSFFPTDGSTAPTSIPILMPDGSTVQREKASVKRIVDGYRRNRDFSYLFLIVTWAANIVDANVTAHLKTFDLTDDISLKVQPTISNPRITEPVFGAKLTFDFHSKK
jgi:hypothetical protein